MPTQTITTYTKQEFIDEHGAPVMSRDGPKEWIFRDGARWNDCEMGYMAPPCDEAEGEWIAIKLQNATAIYRDRREEIKQALSHVSHGLAVAPPTQDEYDQLDQCAEVVALWRKELDAWKAKGGPLTEATKQALQIQRVQRAKDAARRKVLDEGRQRLSELPELKVAQPDATDAKTKARAWGTFHPQEKGPRPAPCVP